MITAGGERQLIVWHPAAVTSLDPDTGRIWWQHDFPIASGLTIGTPVRNGRYLLVTQVENGGLMLALNPDRPAARPVWTGANPNRTDRPVQRSMTSTPIVVGDAIYGLNSYGELRGVDATTGERLWSSDRLVPEDRWASSHLVQHQDRSFISVETGDLVIARFTPAGYEEVDRTHLLTPTTRTRGGGSNPLENPRPRGPVGASGVRQPPRDRAQPRRGRPPLAGSCGLRVEREQGVSRHERENISRDDGAAIRPNIVHLMPRTSIAWRSGYAISSFTTLRWQQRNDGA